MWLLNFFPNKKARYATQPGIPRGRAYRVQEPGRTLHEATAKASVRAGRSTGPQRMPSVMFSRFLSEKLKIFSRQTRENYKKARQQPRPNATRSRYLPRPAFAARLRPEPRQGNPNAVSLPLLYVVRGVCALSIAKSKRIVYRKPVRFWLELRQQTKESVMASKVSPSPTVPVTRPLEPAPSAQTPDPNMYTLGLLLTGIFCGTFWLVVGYLAGRFVH